MATAQSSTIKKIAISTGGGDAPGLNAVIRATALSAIYYHRKNTQTEVLFH
jgi:6-phosphofructokinase